MNFRVGTTSYILPAEILPNVRFLANKIEDVELVLFEVDDGPSNLLSLKESQELQQIASEHGLTYTVHLPLNLHLSDQEDLQDASLQKAKKAIDCTKALNPWAYVLHLDGKQVLENPSAKPRWLTQTLKALSLVAGWAGGPQLLAVENLENYPLDFLDEVFQQSGVSCCIDIGHLWLEGHDPVAFLEKNLKRARVLHLHGIAVRDHQSLAHVPAAELNRVLDCIQCSGFEGVMTLEVFSREDFMSSMEHLKHVLDTRKLEANWKKNSR
ncbi:MAG: cobamide remodeling phosphodiesterase CbiR [Anaerolineaceae bacterium]|nr:cobamide remodeling phosphodiesterase CbiR [Anaerolineaceae bacterium]